MNLLELIPKGNKNAISREELCRRAGITDRLVRRYIAELNGQGQIILNTGAGYFRYSGRMDDRYLNEYLATERARVRAINRKIRKMERARG